MAGQGNTTAIGLGYHWQRDRRAAIAAMPDGTPCDYCGHPMWKHGQPLDYDHVIPRALGGKDGPRRIVHRSCNRSAGAALGNRMRRGTRTPRRSAYTRW